MVLWLTGCFLFITDSRHQERLADFDSGIVIDTGDSGDTSDSGDTDTDDSGDSGDSGDTGDEPYKFAGTYDGPIMLTIDMASDPTCEGIVDLLVSSEGNITGSGTCTIVTFATIEFDVVGTTKGSFAGGRLIFDEENGKTSTWSGGFFTKDVIVQLRATVEGSLEISGQERDFTGSFELD